MRRPAWRALIRSLLDIRLSRFSLAVLACLSALATVVIVTSGRGRSPAQVAALAALREPTLTITQTVTQPAPAAATTPAPSPSGATAGSGAGAGASDSAASDSGASGSGSSGAVAAANSDSATGTSSGQDSSATGAAASTSGATATSTLPKVGHVFEIGLSTTSYAAVFGHGSAAPYLRSLESKGTLLSGYRSLGAGELPDDLAAVSGQGPNGDTTAGCAAYADFPARAAATADGLVPGRGCVYPETALTVGDQVSAAGHVWKAYIEDQGKEACSHPNSDAADDVALTGTDRGYDTRHNPFIYFHSLLDLGDCASDDVDLTKLPSALAATRRTATFSYIAPGECDDATTTASTTLPAAASATNPAASSTSSSTSTSTTSSSTSASTSSTTTTTASRPSTTASVPAATPAPRTCPSGEPVGIAGEDAFLKLWVPRILASPAYRLNGVLLITFAGAKRSGARMKTGALVLSRYAHRGKTIADAYTPYSLLRSVEDILGYTPLAKAKQATSFAQAVLVKTM